MPKSAPVRLEGRYNRYRTTLSGKSAPPPGTQSVVGRGGIDGYHDEIIVYSEKHIKIKYVLEISLEKAG